MTEEYRKIKWPFSPMARAYPVAYPASPEAISQGCHSHIDDRLFSCVRLRQ